MPVVKESPIPLYLQIEGEIRGRIDRGELTPLAQLSSEAELSEEFRVSRMTARKAVDRLVGDGILFRRPGKGTFVAPVKVEHTASSQLSFSAAMDALGRRHSTRVLDAGLVSAPAKVAIDLQLTSSGQVVYLRRVRLLEDEPVAIHIAYLPIQFAGILEHDLTGSLTALMQTTGARITESHDTLEAVSATGDDARWLRVAAGAPLVRIEGTAYGMGLQPLRYSDALYRADRFRFGINSSRQADLRVEIKGG